MVQLNTPGPGEHVVSSRHAASLHFVLFIQPKLSHNSKATDETDPVLWPVSEYTN